MALFIADAAKHFPVLMEDLAPTKPDRVEPSPDA